MKKKNKSLLVINPRDMNSQMAYVHHLNYMAKNTEIDLFLLCSDLGVVNLHPSVKVFTYKKTQRRFLFALGFYRKAVEIISKNKVDVVISSYGHFNSLLPIYWLIRKLSNIERHDCHLVYDIRSASVSGFMDSLQDSMFRIESFFYDSTMAVSATLAQKIFGKRSVNSFISGVGTFKAAHFVDNEATENDIKRIRTKWNISPSSLIMIYIGTLSNRGLDKFIEKFNFDGDFQFFIIGDGNQESTDILKESISTKQLQNNIHLCGRLPHEKLLPYLAMADVGIAATLNIKSLETQPMTKLHEYREFGLIIIVSDNMKNENIDEDVFSYSEVNSVSQLRNRLHEVRHISSRSNIVYWDEISKALYTQYFN